MAVSPLSLALLAEPHSSANRVQVLTEALGVPVVSEPLAADLLLRFTSDHLELCKPGDPELPGALWVDFASPAARRRVSRPGDELLVRAAKVRHTVQPLLIDATAGLGRDGFLLAASGFRVWMFECNPVVAALLADGLQRAAADPRLGEVASRIRLRAANALDLWPTLTERPEVIYLDPMFPQRTKTAKVKQELRLLQLLDQKTEPPEELLRAALALAIRKVVVKRPLKGPFLADRLPSYTLKGKAVRFDVYVGTGKETLPS